MPRTDASTDWRPGAGSDVLEMRALLLARIRAFFRERGVLEVDTPVLSRAATTDPAIESFRTAYCGPGAAGDTPLYLHSSPEFFMKRLLAAGSGPVYQLAHVFRNGEFGARHNPEFMMLEWYRPGFGYQALMDEVDALLAEVLEGLVAYQPARRRSYRAWFLDETGLDPWRDPVSAFRAFAAQRLDGALPALEDSDRDGWLDLLVTHWLEPRLAGSAHCIFDYPPSQASLARLRQGEEPVAERFEFYLGAVELANGFHELADAEEQRRRFAAENAQRAQRGQPAMPVDAVLIDALAHGLPDCSGVALGFDRLVMAAAGASSLEQVMPFGFDRV